MAILTATNPRRVNTFDASRLARALGVPKDNIFHLIAYTWTADGSGWPQEFRMAYLDAPTLADKAGVAVERIEHFIKTGE